LSNIALVNLAQEKQDRRHSLSPAVISESAVDAAELLGRSDVLAQVRDRVGEYEAGSRPFGNQ
jgi:hypothetical protein